jgi:signal peptidase I
MADLSGSLASVDLASLVQFLAALGKTGDLLVSRDHWFGQLSLDRGRLIAAAFDNEVGQPALELIASGLAHGSFEFSEGPPTLPATADLPRTALDDLAALASEPPAAWAAAVPGPHAIPRLPASALDGTSDTSLAVARGTVYVLLDIDGQRTVRALAERHGLSRTLKALGRLAELGLVEFARPEPSPIAASASPSTVVSPVPGRPRVLDRLRHFGAHATEHRAVRIGLELAQVAVFTGVMMVGIRSVVQNFRVEGVSMQPTFDGGQVLLVNRAAYFHVDGTPLARVLPTSQQGSVAYLFGGPQRGDVVVFRAPPQPDTDYIKRVIGLPGDTVAVRSGQVIVNDKPLAEPYIRFTARYNFGPVVVPDGSYFVLGDNRPESLDSHFGWFVPADQLIGRAWIRFWPLSQMGVVQPALPAPSSDVAQASSR